MASSGARRVRFDAGWGTRLGTVELRVRSGRCFVVVAVVVVVTEVGGAWLGTIV